MSTLSVFCFEGQDVRFIEGKPIANDVAIALGFKNPADAVYRLIDKAYKGVCRTQTPGGIQAITVLEEPGIYQLIFSSKLDAAQRFQHWIFKEVLTSIRQKGFYIEKVEGRKLPTNYEEALEVLLGMEKERKVLAAKVESDAPLVKLAETLTIKQVDTVSIGDLARSYGIGRTTFFEILRQIAFIQQKPCRQPYQHHIDAGRAEVYRKERLQQPGMFDNVTVLTAKGQEYIAGKLAELDHFQQAEVAMEAVVALQG